MPSTFNARAETVAEKPMFRSAFKRARCIVPASGYYEWRPAEGGKQPYFISAADGAVLSIAGLWDQWKEPETRETISSATLIVTAANDFTRRIHDRMPVLLDRHDLDAWLTGKAGVELLRPAPNDLLRMWPVSKRVNVSGQGDEDPSLIEPVERPCPRPFPQPLCSAMSSMHRCCTSELNWRPINTSLDDLPESASESQAAVKCGGKNFTMGGHWNDSIYFKL